MVQKTSRQFGSSPTPGTLTEAGCGTLQPFCCGKTAQTFRANSRRRVTPTRLVCMEAHWNALVLTCKVLYPCRRLGTLNSWTTVARVVLCGPSVFAREIYISIEHVRKFKKPLTSPQPPHPITSQTMDKCKIARRCHGFESAGKNMSKPVSHWLLKVPTLIISSVTNTLLKSKFCLVAEMSTWQLWLAVTLFFNQERTVPSTTIEQMLKEIEMWRDKLLRVSSRNWKTFKRNRKRKTAIFWLMRPSSRWRERHQLRCLLIPQHTLLVRKQTLTGFALRRENTNIRIYTLYLYCIDIMCVYIIYMHMFISIFISGVIQINTKSLSSWPQ